MTDDRKNQGEGNRQADRRYREKAEAFAQYEDIKALAKKAKEAISGKEGEALREAEERGKAASKGEG